ncbi:MAG: SagB/ThcOx family dehydrogenase [Cyanobacteria bacterium P01_F01_bin.150]
MADSYPSIAHHYHQRTKYDPDTLAQTAKVPDWNHPPSVFKDYKVGTPYSLQSFLSGQSSTPSSDPLSPINPASDLGPEALDYWKRLSRLLLCSYGLTAKMLASAMTPIYFRAVPSAGGLYPAEVYLISKGTAYLPPGLYHYQAQSHSLIHFWDSPVWNELQQACFWHSALDHTQLTLVTTAIFYRSAWRYQARAYRRICLDSGHLLGNIELASAINSFRPHVIGGFADELINKLLYLDSEKEGAIAVLPLADLLTVEQNLPLYPTALPSISAPEHQSDVTATIKENFKSGETIADEDLLNALHCSTTIHSSQDVNWRTVMRHGRDTNVTVDSYNFPFCYKVSTTSANVDWGNDLLGLEQTILKRRSTREYSGATLSFNELKALLDFTYQPQHYVEQGLDKHPDYFDLSLLETFIAVSGVKGLDEGCYYYAPDVQELRQIRFKNFRQELHFLCLGQELGRDAAAVVFHTADLSNAVNRYGDRAYRYLHLDAGHLGQRLNLAAIRLGLGVSGIAGFFDDMVNEVLGIPVEEAVIYITTLGKPR